GLAGMADAQAEGNTPREGANGAGGSCRRVEPSSRESAAALVGAMGANPLVHAEGEPDAARAADATEGNTLPCSADGRHGRAFARGHGDGVGYPQLRDP